MLVPCESRRQLREAGHVVIGIELFAGFAALAIVAVAAGLLARSRFQRRKFSFERDTHCGCAASESAARQSSIVFRARKGQRPEVLVKMR